VPLRIDTGGRTTLGGVGDGHVRRQ
jgi:hypothetical protein